MNTHAHDHQPKQYGTLFIIGIALNGGYIVIEAFYGWHIQSLALLADAGHNLGDVAGLILAWLSMLAARLNTDDRKLDRDHLLEQISKQLQQQENLNHITVQVESEDAAENCLLMHCIKQ